ncbi:EAL domain-containing protein [Desulfobacter curvatus]|uniref:EAL domain-containing protein n=1 Tax=Desulfobacter curvatus TaxID=2290 RepID=UPI00036CD3AB|nr:EAL domain-containing protein [Desulfobacter curvatus]
MRPSTPDKLDQLLLHLSLTISLVVVLSLPAVSAFVAYSDLSKEITFKARIKANAQKEMISTLPQTWMFAENRMQGILAREPVLLENEYVQIFDYQGNELTSAGEAIDGLFIHRSYPLYDVNQIMGKVVVSASLSHVIHNTLISSVLGLVVGALVMLVLWFLPVKKLRQISAELYEEKQQAEATLQSIHDGVLRTDKKGRLVYLNPAAEKLIGRSFGELNGKAVSEILTLIEDQTNSKIESALYKAIHEKEQASCQGHCSLISHDNRTIAVEERAVPLLDNSGKLIGGVLCLSDVTIFRKRLKQQSWQASHDALTGLINRREFEERVAKAIDRAQVEGRYGLLCFMDLDGFKIVNDTSGHNAGDELLIQLARLIGAQVRTSDSLARLGGDEFGLLLDGCDEERGRIIANSILSVVKNFHFLYDGKTHTVGISIGMTSVNSNSIKATDVIREADSACYLAKDSGRHRLCIFQDNKTALKAKRDEVSWVERMKSALEEDRFSLYHQTYQTLSDHAGPRQHLEILLRLVSESGEIIPPDRFFPAAERYNLMRQIDRWVINKVFSEFHNIRVGDTDAGLIVNINLSGASINAPELYDFIKTKMTEHNIDPTSICFEITETVAVRNFPAATDFINKCKKIGIQFALDDFGIGASSFNYVKNMPVDYLKIDGSFVKNIEQDNVDRAMTETINRIGHLLGKKTIAEFAENKTIIEILSDIGVDFAQGFAVCKPMPLIKT